MIEPKQYFEVYCDKCGERLVFDGVTAQETKQDAVDLIDFCAWQIDSAGKVTCFSCQLNDED